VECPVITPLRCPQTLQRDQFSPPHLLRWG